MTETEWLTCIDPTPMLRFLEGKMTDRKLRLFACACCRRVWNLLSDKYSRKALMIAERYADAEASKDKLGFAWGDARRAARVAYRQQHETADASAMWAVSILCEADIGRAMAAVGLAALGPLSIPVVFLSGTYAPLFRSVRRLRGGSASVSMPTSYPGRTEPVKLPSRDRVRAGPQ